MTTSSPTERQALRAGTPAGTDVAQRLAALYGKAHVALVASGGAALEIALASLDVGRGDEVLVPPTGCYKIGAAVLRTGATPVFVPVGQALVLTPEAVVSAMRPAVRAVVAVHEHGLPCPVARLREVLPPSVSVIEDVAQAWDVDSEGVAAGTMGDRTVTSFGPTKPVALGAGGALFADDPDISALIDSGDVAQRHVPHAPFLAPFPAPLLPALGDAMAAANRRVAAQRSFAAAILPVIGDHGLKSWSGSIGDRPAWHRVPVWCRTPSGRERLMAALDRAGLPAERPHTVSLPELPMFESCRAGTPVLHDDLDQRLVLLKPCEPPPARHELDMALRAADMREPGQG